MLKALKPSVWSDLDLCRWTSPLGMLGCLNYLIILHLCLVSQ